MTEQREQPPIPAMVLSGFLGSGKTTLLNGLLRAPHGLKVAVIVNEFGAVGVDGALVAGEAQFVELDNGCLCCALNEDLDKTLRALVQRGGFDCVVVETTGLADPLPVAWSFTKPGLSHAFRVDAIVTVVDALNLASVLEQASEARQQLLRADIVVLSKLDLVPDGGAAARQLIGEHNSLAPILVADHGDLPWDVLVSNVPADRPTVAPAAGHHHHASFQTWAFETEAVLSELDLEDMLNAMPPEVYRLKGFVRTDAGWGEWTLVNAVAGRIDLRPCEPTRQPVRGGLVFIGPKLDVADLQARCAELLRLSAKK